MQKRQDNSAGHEHAASQRHPLPRAAKPARLPSTLAAVEPGAGKRQTNPESAPPATSQRLPSALAGVEPHAKKLSLQPMTLREANRFVDRHHRHHGPTVGHKFSIAANDGQVVVGVVIVGRPVSRHLDDGYTAEVLRLCTDGTRNVCSFLYSAAWRAARGMGYRKIITYILDTERGTSLTASGWKCIGKAGGGTWNSAGRPRVDKHPIQPKL